MHNNNPLSNQYLLWPTFISTTQLCKVSLISCLIRYIAEASGWCRTWTRWKAICATNRCWIQRTSGSTSGDHGTLSRGSSKWRWCPSTTFSFCWQLPSIVSHSSLYTTTTPSIIPHINQPCHDIKQHIENCTFDPWTCWKNNLVATRKRPWLFDCHQSTYYPSTHTHLPMHSIPMHVCIIVH